MKEAIEITTFMLRDGESMEGFIAKNANVDAWLVGQKGFRSRRIAQGQDGQVVDLLVWSSATAARKAMQRLMTELGDSPVHGAINQRSVNWTVSTVLHTLLSTD